MTIQKALPAALTLALILVAGGCGGKSRYTHPTFDLAKQESDLSECDWEASKATGNVQKESDRSSRVEELIDKCMKSKGYKRN